MIKYITSLSLFFIFSTSTIFAGDHLISQKQNTTIKVSIDMEKASMIMLPGPPKSVTGRSMPNYQVEPIGDKIMVTPLKLGAKTNLFLDLGDGTVVTLELLSVNGGGESLITLRSGEGKDGLHEKKSYTRNTAIEGNGDESHLTDLPTDLNGPWNYKKLKDKSSSAGIVVQINSALIVKGKAIVSFSVSNKRNETLSLKDIDTVVQTLGGISGNTIVSSESLPSSLKIENQILSTGETAFGTFMMSVPSLEFNQTLALKVGSDLESMEVRFAL